VPKRLGAVLFALVLVAAGCGDDDDDAGAGDAPENGGGGGSETVSVSIADFAFDPDETEVPAGSEVTFEITNDDSVPHTYTSDDLDLDIEVDPGDSAEETVEVGEAGEFEVRCRIHPTMSATITAT
jgi:plastocyanin